VRVQSEGDVPTQQADLGPARLRESLELAHALVVPFQEQAGAGGVLPFDDSGQRRAGCFGDVYEYGCRVLQCLFLSTT
jgi:hypothetical protein